MNNFDKKYRFFKSHLFEWLFHGIEVNNLTALQTVDEPADG